MSGKFDFVLTALQLALDYGSPGPRLVDLANDAISETRYPRPAPEGYSTSQEFYFYMPQGAGVMMITAEDLESLRRARMGGEKPRLIVRFKEADGQTSAEQAGNGTAVVLDNDTPVEFDEAGLRFGVDTGTGRRRPRLLLGTNRLHRREPGRKEVFVTFQFQCYEVVPHYAPNVGLMELQVKLDSRELLEGRSDWYTSVKVGESSVFS